MKAAENGQFFDLAFFRRVVRRKTASTVLLCFRKPNWCGPTRLWASAMSVILLVILTVRSLRRLDGTVIGLYWPGERESPPCKW